MGDRLGIPRAVDFFLFFFLFSFFPFFLFFLLLVFFLFLLFFVFPLFFLCFSFPLSFLALSFLLCLFFSPCSNECVWESSFRRYFLTFLACIDWEEDFWVLSYYLKKKVSAFWVSLEVKRTRSPSSDLVLGFCMSMLQQKGRELMWTLDSGLCLWCGFHVHPWGHGRAHGVQGNVRLARYMYKCIHVVSRFVRCRVRSIWYGTLVSCDVRR